MKPTLGRIVHYKSKIDNGPGNDVISPAMVIRTRASTVLAVVERWAPQMDAIRAGDGTLVVPAGRPENFVEVLPDDDHVDLLVYGLGKTYREYCVPHGTERGQWDWPPRQPEYSPTPEGLLTEGGDGKPTA